MPASTTKSSPEVKAILRVLPYVACGLVAGCSLDAYPSLGWDKHSRRVVEDAAADGDASVDASEPSEPDASANASDAGVEPIDCPTGLYIADLMCTVDPVGFVSTMQIRFVLEQKTSSSPEATASMPFFTTASSGLLLADLDAKLDCVTGAFHADVTNGFALLVPIPVVAPFEGVIDGQLDEEAGLLAGTWSMSTPPGTPLSTLATCDGEWSAPVPR